MQYFILGILIILGLIFTKSKGISAGLFFIDWVLFAFNRGNADYKNYMINYQSSKMIQFFLEIILILVTKISA